MNKLNFVLLLLSLTCGNYSLAQGLFSAEDEIDKLARETYGKGLNDEEWEELDKMMKELAQEGIDWSDHTVGGSVGLGYQRNNTFQETGLTASAEYLFNVVDKGHKGAAYLGANFNFEHINYDIFKEINYEIGPKFILLKPVTPRNEVQVLLGSEALLVFGYAPINGIDRRSAGYGITAFTGANYRFNNKCSLGFEFPVFSFSSLTFTTSSTETKSTSTSFAVNVNNPIKLTFRLNIGKSSKPTYPYPPE